ncbi:hypothetical protein PTKIN_Ptkin04bG0103100 [Pterospermum kingtungense]
MRCFRLWKSLLHELNMMTVAFRCGDDDNRRHIHWKSWDALCISKMDGGLSFCDFEAFILAKCGASMVGIFSNLECICVSISRKCFSHDQLLLHSSLVPLVELNLWRPSSGDLFKHNTDARFMPHSYLVCLRVVARDSSSSIVFSVAKSIGTLHSASQAKILAIKMALTIARRVGLQRVVWP